MYSIQEQFKTDALAQINGRVRDAQAIAGTFLDLSREIGVLNVRTTKASAEQVAGAVQKLLGASNPGEFFQIAAAVMQPDMQLWTRYIEQLGSIAGKASAPASLAAPVVTWPKPEERAGEPAAAVEQEPAQAPAVPEQMQLEAAMEPAPVVPPPAAVPYLAPLEERAEETKQAVSETEAGTVEAIREVADAMTGAQKTPPVVMAASTPLVSEPVMPEIAMAPKSASARPVRKPVAPPAAKKAAQPARSASGRGRKG
nr:phasin family protein [uncultured Noviherbaspirillum sp.]